MGLAVVVDNTKNNDDVIEKSNKSKRKVRKDGNLYCFSSENKGKQKGDKAYPLKTLEEIAAVIEYYEKKADDPNTKEGYRWIADRNKLLSILGFNVGIRASDLTAIKWCNVYDLDGNFLTPDDEEVEDRRSSRIIEKKTQKVKNLIFNGVVREAFEEFVEKYNINKSSNDYVFKSRQKAEDGEYHISVTQCSNVIKEAVKECGIKRRVASHTYRKTYSLFQMNAHQDDGEFVAALMELLNQSDLNATFHYTCKDVDKLVQYHEDVQLGKVSTIRNHKKIEVNHNKEIIIDKTDIEYLIKQLSEKCYTCTGNNCETCYNAILAKKYGYDINTI